MRTSAVIVAATLISVPALTAALPTPPFNRGPEGITPDPPAHYQRQHSIEHQVHKYDPSEPAVYQHDHRLPLPVRRSRLAYEHGIERYPLSHHAHSHQGSRMYGREAGSGALSSKVIISALKDGAKYGGDILTYGTDAYEAWKAGKSLWNGTHWRREEGASGTVKLEGAIQGKKGYNDDVRDASYGRQGTRATRKGRWVQSGVPQGSGAISAKQVLQVGKDAFQIGSAAHDAWEAGKDAWHQFKGRSMESGAISSQGLLQVGHDALQIGNDVHDVYESGKDAFEAGEDAYHQFRSRSMGSGAISTGQVVGVAKDAWTIGNDAYDAYKAGKDAWQQLKSRSMERRKISAGGALQAGNDALQIGHDAYDAYEAGKDAWHVVKGPRELLELEELD